MQLIKKVISALFLIFLTSCSWNKPPKNASYTYEVIVPELQIPWGFTFLPDGSLLINEKKGELIHYKNHKKTKLVGLPKIVLSSQGGLLDIELHPDFKNNGWIYITYATANGEDDSKSNTALMRFKIKNNELVDKELLYKATPDTEPKVHFGSRIEFDNEGYLYFSIGDRYNRDVNPQNITKDGGKIYRLNDDGSVPDTNPFIGRPNAKEATFSYGHRNPQGMEKHPKTGAIWIHEHGPKGGDEINIIKKGKNYGWPKVTYGINYDGTKITDKKVMTGMESPIHFWTPSIAPSGMSFVTSDVYPELKDNLLVGSLRFQFLNLCILDGDKVVKEERLLDEIGRVRSIEQGPDGFIYIGVENLGIVKLVKKK